MSFTLARMRNLLYFLTSFRCQLNCYLFIVVFLSHPLVNSTLLQYNVLSPYSVLFFFAFITLHLSLCTCHFALFTAVPRAVTGMWLAFKKYLLTELKVERYLLVVESGKKNLNSLIWKLYSAFMLRKILLYIKFVRKFSLLFSFFE